MTDYRELAERLRRHFDDCPPSLGDKSSTRPLLIEAAEAIEKLTDMQIRAMTQRFLRWKLPADFHPDAGIKFEPEFNVEYNASKGLPPHRHEPLGTNLFTYTQAEAMIRHLVEGL